LHIPEAPARRKPAEAFILFPISPIWNQLHLGVNIENLPRLGCCRGYLFSIFQWAKRSSESHFRHRYTDEKKCEKSIQ